MNANSLLARCREGDPDALDILARRYQPLVERLALAVLDGEEPASLADAVHQVVQQTLLAAISAGNLFRDESDLMVWMLSTALKVSRKHLRRSVRAASMQAQEEPLESGGPLTAHAALRRLDDVFRYPLLLHYTLGLSLPEVAQVLRISQASVEARMGHAREQMRVLLEVG